MKVLIVTLHRVWNWGSVLQTYATQEIYKRVADEVVIADYIQERFKRKSVYLSFPRRYQKNILLKNIYRLLMFPMRVRLDFIFSKFLRKINLTKKKYYCAEEMQSLNSEFDVFVTGSDQVWNSEYNGNVDPVLYLEFAESNKNCMAFAASFGFDAIPEREQDDTKKYLRKYKNISVRENTGVMMLKKLGYDATHVLDPTLVLTKDEWSKFATKRRVEKKYLLLYALHGCEGVLELVKEISKRLGLIIVSINYGYKSLRRLNFDKYLSPHSPEDFVSLIKNAEYVVADSFHGTVFSINFNKNFIAVPPQKYESRLRSILETLDIQERIYTDTMTLEEAITPINYDRVNLKLEQEREKTINFMYEAIQENGKK